MGDIWRKCFCAQRHKSRSESRLISAVLDALLCSCFVDDDHQVHASLTSLKGRAFALSCGELNTGALRCDCIRHNPGLVFSV